MYTKELRSPFQNLQFPSPDSSDSSPFSVGQTPNVDVVDYALSEGSRVTRKESRRQIWRGGSHCVQTLMIPTDPCEMPTTPETPLTFNPLYGWHEIRRNRTFSVTGRCRMPTSKRSFFHRRKCEGDTSFHLWVNPLTPTNVFTLPSPMSRTSWITSKSKNRWSQPATTTTGAMKIKTLGLMTWIWNARKPNHVPPLNSVY